MLQYNLCIPVQFLHFFRPQKDGFCWILTELPYWSIENHGQNQSMATTMSLQDQ